ncbi:hypothetical protein B1J93_03835 [Leptospira kirschneri serovar Pomona]|uniref:Immunity MXAN-0049 protein domain-containing protein n=2 Tax=Leptospira kirschneri TaxID=29507 RepID=A0A1T1E0J4_9LEPT|nr:hypothetical protein B1J93_03835 [Leptospira kirschneri serovar Pomona]
MVIVMYWFLTEDLSDMSMKNFHGHSANSGKQMWTTGYKFQEPFPIEKFEVSTRQIGYGFPDGDEMLDLFDSTVPLMSDRLLDALRGFGIENITCYPVIIVDKGSNRIWNNYSAVNVLGRIDALDRKKTKTKRNINETNPVYLSVVINFERIPDLLCFRLHKGPRELVIHERIAKSLLNQNFKGLLLIPTENYDQTEI